MLRVDVIDDGQGIDAATLPYIFDMFRQRARDRAKGGLGIGLALVRQLVEMHGGHISAVSDGPGRGTAMTVWLPAVAEERAPSGSTGEEPQCIAGLRVLLVEDERETAASLTALLELEGAVVRAAASGAAALNMLPDEPVDAVVSDIGPPDMNGYELVCRIRADARWAGMPAIALTGHSPGTTFRPQGTPGSLCTWQSRWISSNCSRRLQTRCLTAGWKRQAEAPTAAEVQIRSR